VHLVGFTTETEKHTLYDVAPHPRTPESLPLHV